MRLLAREPSFVCVITYQYNGKDPYELASKPTSRAHAEWQMRESDELFEGNEHVLRAVVYTEADYQEHLKRRVAEAALVAL